MRGAANRATQNVTRLDIDVRDHSRRAVTALAQHDDIDEAQALERLAQYRKLVTAVEGAASACGEESFLVAVPEGDYHVILTRRRRKGRGWLPFRYRYVIERLRVPDHGIDEQPRR